MDLETLLELWREFDLWVYWRFGAGGQLFMITVLIALFISAPIAWKVHYDFKREEAERERQEKNAKVWRSKSNESL